jgi:hypothetical protein
MCGGPVVGFSDQRGRGLSCLFARAPSIVEWPNRFVVEDVLIVMK